MMCLNVCARSCTHAQVPKAPPHTLALTAATFTPFSRGGGAEPVVARLTGTQLALREGGLRAQQAFQEQVGRTCGCAAHPAAPPQGLRRVRLLCSIPQELTAHMCAPASMATSRPCAACFTFSSTLIVLQHAGPVLCASHGVATS